MRFIATGYGVLAVLVIALANPLPSVITIDAAAADFPDTQLRSQVADSQLTLPPLEAVPKGSDVVMNRISEPAGLFFGPSLLPLFSFGRGGLLGGLPRLF